MKAGFFDFWGVKVKFLYYATLNMCYEIVCSQQDCLESIEILILKRTLYGSKKTLLSKFFMDFAKISTITILLYCDICCKS